jgi:hypothetical protein
MWPKKETTGRSQLLSRREVSVKSREKKIVRVELHLTLACCAVSVGSNIKVDPRVCLLLHQEKSTGNGWAFSWQIWGSQGKTRRYHEQVSGPCNISVSYSSRTPHLTSEAHVWGHMTVFPNPSYRGLLPRNQIHELGVCVFFLISRNLELMCLFPFLKDEKSTSQFSLSTPSSLW